MLLTMLLVWGIVNVVLLCLWAGIVGFARRGVDEGRRAIRADLAFTVLALVFVMAGTSLANPSVRQVVGSVIQTTTSGFGAPRTPVQATNGRVTPRQTASSPRRIGPALGGSVPAPIGAGTAGSSRQSSAGEAGAPGVGAPPDAANPVPPAAPPSEPAPVPSPPPTTSPDPSPSCGDGGSSGDPCPSPSDSPSPDGATSPGA